MIRAFVVLAAVHGLAVASPQSTKLVMKHVDGTNLHIANQDGAIHWTADVAVAVELRADHKVEASATGWFKEHNLYTNGSTSYTTDEETKFTTRWTGTWSETAGVLRLELVLGNEICSHTKAGSGTKPEGLACKVASKRTTLTCTTEQVALEGAGTIKQKVAAWNCQPGGAGDLGESPSWLLGKTTCITTSSGRTVGSGPRICQP